MASRQAWDAKKHDMEAEEQALAAREQYLEARERALAAKEQALNAKEQALNPEEQASAAKLSEAISLDPLGVPPTIADVIRPTIDPLEEVRQSFMKMAPMALGESGLYEADSVWEKFELSESQIIELWSTVWASFDFTESQYIDIEQPWDKQPRDLRILLASLGLWTHFSTRDLHGIRDSVPDTSLYWEKMTPETACTRVEDGLKRLGKFFKYNRALRPQAPSGPSGSTRPLPVPFPWLDVQLSHFQHLGWKLLDQPLSEDDDPIDYNDFQEFDDPRAESILKPEDHFRAWREGGLLLTDVRVPLPRQLIVSRYQLGGPLRALYSVQQHPLCLIGQAWDFACRFCDTPTDADLRAAMLYQVIFRINSNGLLDPWGMWTGDKTLSKLNWPSEIPAPKAYLP